jgi:small GTP-binding protein
MSGSKVIFLGSMSVGKTSLITRITTGKFPELTSPTTATAHAQFSPKDHPGVVIQFWDTSGMEKYRAINSIYYREACAALLVFDLTERQSFDDVGMWLGDFEKSTAMENSVKFLVGNKCDLVSEIVVEEELARSWSDERGIQYFAVSGLTGEGISELIDALVRCVPRMPSSSPQQPLISIQKQPDAIPEEKPGCC